MIKINNVLKMFTSLVVLTLLTYIVFSIKRHPVSLDLSHGTYMYQGPEY